MKSVAAGLRRAQSAYHPTGHDESRGRGNEGYAPGRRGFSGSRAGVCFTSAVRLRFSSFEGRLVRPYAGKGAYPGLAQPLPHRTCERVAVRRKNIGDAEELGVQFFSGTHRRDQRYAGIRRGLRDTDLGRHGVDAVCNYVEPRKVDPALPGKIKHPDGEYTAFRIDRGRAHGDSFDFRHPYRFRGRDDLPVEVAGGDVISVNDRQSADPGAYERLANVSPDASCPEDRRVCAGETPHGVFAYQFFGAGVVERHSSCLPLRSLRRPRFFHSAIRLFYHTRHDYSSFFLARGKKLDLKLRAGYGVTGNQDGLQPYKSLELYEAYGTYLSNGSASTAFRVSQNANPDLKWESTSMFNIGLDFSLFNGRFGGTVEYYAKKTKDMLYNYSVPTPTYVYNTITANVGDMTNKGIEVSLNWNVIKTRDFDWTTTLNVSHNKNEVTRLSNDLYKTDAAYVGNPWIRGASGQTSHIVKEGYPIGQFYMLKCTGLSEDGHFIIEDVNGDGNINEDDRTFVGDAQPDLEFGWTNNFTWKNWDFSFFLRGSLGQKVLNNPLAAYGNNTYIDGYNVMKNDDLLKLSENSRVCSYYIENASYARLDNMTLGYTFNTKKINWLEKARLYVTAQNLFVITGYKGLDPEVELYTGAATDSNAGLSPGIEPRDYFPKSRSFTFGVNLTF